MEFGDTPKDWPDHMPTCHDGAYGAFGMFDHVNLFTSTSPIGRPIAIYFGESPMHGFAPLDAKACGKLHVPKSSHWKIWK